MIRFALMLLLCASSIQAQTLVVVDSTKWIHAVAPGSPFDSTRMTLAPGQIITIRYDMKDVRIHPPVDVLGGVSLWTTNNPSFVVKGDTLLHSAILGLSMTFNVGDSAQVFMTLSSPRATTIPPEIGAFVFYENKDVYECRETRYPHVAMWVSGDLLINFQDDEGDSLYCRDTKPVPQFTSFIQAEALPMGPEANTYYELKVRVVDSLGDPVVGAVLAFEVVSGQWGNNTTTTRACSTNADGVCLSTNRFLGTIRITVADAEPVLITR